MSKKRLIRAYKGETRKYEIACILSQTLSQDAAKNKMEELKAIATSLGASVENVALSNLKSFAYAINSTNNKKGYYGCLYLNIKGEDLAELIRKFSIQDDVLRTLALLADPTKQSHGVFAPNYEDETYKARKKVIAYDDPNTLIKFLGERGKIEPRKQSLGRNVPAGLALRQRLVSKAIKRSRFLSLLPYIEE